MAARLTIRAVPALALGVWAMACGTPSPAVSSAVCDRWAAPNGSDRAPGTADRPLHSVQRLADRLRPGQTGCLRGGTYSDEVDGPYVLRVAHGGRDRAPITVRSAPGERATLRGIVYVPKGADHVTLASLDIDGRRPRPTEAPVSIQVMARATTIEDSDITNHGVRSCVLLGSNSHWGGAVRTVLRGNVFHDCGARANGMLDHAVYIAESSRAKITDNVFVRSAGWAVQLYPNAQRTLIARNVVWDNGGGVVFASEGSLTSNRNVVEANVIGASRSRPELTSSWGGPVGRGNVARRNCIVPGSAPWSGPLGFAVTGNRVLASGQGSAACAGFISTATAARATTLAPATLSLLRRS